MSYCQSTVNFARTRQKNATGRLSESNNKIVSQYIDMQASRPGLNYNLRDVIRNSLQL